MNLRSGGAARQQREEAWSQMLTRVDELNAVLDKVNDSIVTARSQPDIKEVDRP